MWLPSVRTSSKPFFRRISQHSLPERRRSLPNRYLDARYKHLVVQPLHDFCLVGGFQEEFQGFLEVCMSLFYCSALAGNVQLRTQRNVHVILALDQSRESSRLLHVPLSLAFLTKGLLRLLLKLPIPDADCDIRRRMAGNPR